MTNQTMHAALEQIERLSRTANPAMVNVPAMLGDIARNALTQPSCQQQQAQHKPAARVHLRKPNEYQPAHVVAEPMTDDSKVYNVEIEVGSRCICIIAAIDEATAYVIADTINKGSSWVSTCSAAKVPA